MPRRQKAWSLRGTLLESPNGLESSSPSASQVVVASLTLPMSGMSVTRLNAGAAGKQPAKLKKDRRDKEVSALATAKENAAKKSDGAAVKKEPGLLQHLTVGAVAGGVSRSVVAPLERVKIEYMIDSSKVAAEGGMMGTLRRIVRMEGAVGLFRGNMLNVLRIAPTKAVELYCFDKYKEWRWGKGSRAAPTPLSKILPAFV